MRVYFPAFRSENAISCRARRKSFMFFPEGSVKYRRFVIATAPILAIYPFIQKYFVKGVMVGALKG